MARREEKVDAELLARLESGSGDKIRVPLPNRKVNEMFAIADQILGCLLYTSPSPRDQRGSRMPSSA